MFHYIMINKSRSREDPLTPEDPDLSIANARPVSTLAISKLSRSEPLRRRNATQVAGVKSPGQVNDVVILAELEKSYFEVLGSLPFGVGVLAT
jgi:hypothetical protein